MLKRLFGLQDDQRADRSLDLPASPWPHIAEISAQEFADVDALAERLGLEIQLQPYRKELAGTLTRFGDRWVIGVNKAHTLTRRRFTVAHEIGHFIMHADLVSSREGLRVVADGMDYRQPDVDGLRNPHILVQHERQASEIAIRVLMGEAKMRVLMDEGFDADQIAPLIGCSAKTTAIRIDGLRQR